MILTITNETPYTLSLVMPPRWSTTSNSGESGGGLYTWPDIPPSRVGSLAVNPQWQSQIEAWCAQYNFTYTLE